MRWFSGASPYRSIFGDFVRKLVRRCRAFRKMLRQSAADVADRIHERVGEAFVPEMFTHKIDNALPITLAEFLVNGLVADDGKLAGAWRHKNQHGISFGRLVHP